jgi:ribulose-phosphate 3-epimerase
MIQIIPSILTDDIGEARELLVRCEQVVDRVSIDIIDGKFADNKTIEPGALGVVESDLMFDYQLMTVEPLKWVETCIASQADRIIGHVERMTDQKEFTDRVKESGLSAGLGFDLKTPLGRLNASTLYDLDVVLLMSVPAGFGGQEFRMEVIDKIRKLDKLRLEKRATFKIHVDGGVTSDNISKVSKAGADEVSVGRGLFKGDLKENLERLSKAVKGN